MCNEKIGRFIAAERKNQQLTQKELAQKLNVTDKAVSKWERGLSYPDISLLSPLSDTLNITVVELLNGERGEDEETNTESQAAIENVLVYADKAAKSKTKSLRKLLAIAALGAVVIFIGIMLLESPIRGISTSHVQRRHISNFSTGVVRMLQHEIDEHFYAAQEHNADLQSLPQMSPLNLGVRSPYWEGYINVLNVGGVMGRIEIPAIGVDMPIFHCSYVNTIGANHLSGTSLPIGGHGNHAALSASRTNRVFGDLEHLNIGDTFFITALDRRMMYQIDQIAIVLPHETETLRTIPGEDLVTLITCTPYRINSHRVLVRGSRVHDIE